MTPLASYRRLWGLARGLFIPMVGSGLAPLVATAADLALLALLARFVDQVAVPASPGAGLRLVLLALALVAVRGLSAYLGRNWSVRASAELVERLQNALFSHTHSLSIDFFHRTRPGDLAARLFHDADAAARLVTQVTAAAFDMPLRLGGLFLVIFLLNPILAAGTALVAIPGIFLSRLFARRVRTRCTDLYEALVALYDRAIESWNAAELVKSLGREKEEVSEFVALNRTLVKRQTAFERLRALEGPLGQGLHLLVLVAVLVFGGRELAAHRMTPGQLTAALVAVHALLAGFESLLAWHAEAQSGLAAADRVFAVLDEKPSVGCPPSGRRAAFDTILRFENVTFAYPGRGPLLQDVSFSLRKGERVGLVGPAGSGKTTVLRLALRLLDPTTGRITVDGHDLRELELTSLRALFAVVPQDVLLFDRSIRDNVACGRPSASDECVVAAATCTGLDRVTRRLPAGLETLVGPRGVALSAGERQRVALARAAVREAPILLFDEATSALDATSEQEVQDLLAVLCRERTVLVVAHQASSLRGLDRLLAVDEGRVVAVERDRTG